MKEIFYPIDFDVSTRCFYASVSIYVHIKNNIAKRIFHFSTSLSAYLFRSRETVDFPESFLKENYVFNLNFQFECKIQIRIQTSRNHNNFSNFQSGGKDEHDENEYHDTGETQGRNGWAEHLIKKIQFTLSMKNSKFYFSMELGERSDIDMVGLIWEMLNEAQLHYFECYHI